MASVPADVFRQQLTETIDKFKRDRERHKKSALRLKMGTSVLGAVATILLGWDSPGSYAPVLKNAALMATALITVLAAYDAFFEPRRLWVRETFVLNSLNDLRREFEIAAAVQPLTAEQVGQYGERSRQVLQQSLGDWMKEKQPR